MLSTHNERPVILRSERLILRLVDPDSDVDCQKIVDSITDPNAGKGGNAKIGIENIEDVRKKIKICGPTVEYCTLAPPPRSNLFLIHLPTDDGQGEADFVRTPCIVMVACDDCEAFHIVETPKQLTLCKMGQMSMSFRLNMPYPDIGYGIGAAYEGKGYASEAGRKVLEWWRDVIGVKEIWCGTMPDNARSQKCAERIGFVRAGTLDVVFGNPPHESQRIKGALAFVLPGMEWKEGMTIYPTIQ